MDRIFRKKEKVVSVSDIERSANFEGNETLLFHKRLQNPKIKRMLVDLISEYQQTIDPPSSVWIMDKNDKPIEVPKSDWMPEWEKEHAVQTKKEILDDLDNRIKKVFSLTNVTYTHKGVGGFSSGLGDFGTMIPHSVNPENKEKFTIKQLSGIEAHEKGHSIRYFHESGKAFKEKILSGFDFSKVQIPEKSKELQRNKFRENGDERFANDKEVTDKIIEYFSDPMEIIERMSQLKNYFGMSGAEIFTKAHLDYARKNYSKDIGFSMQIEPFFDAITPETEDRFLELINSLGI